MSCEISSIVHIISLSWLAMPAARARTLPLGLREKPRKSQVTSERGFKLVAPRARMLQTRLIRAVSDATDDAKTGRNPVIGVAGTDRRVAPLLLLPVVTRAESAGSD